MYGGAQTVSLGSDMLHLCAEPNLCVHALSVMLQEYGGSIAMLHESHRKFIAAMKFGSCHTVATLLKRSAMGRSQCWLGPDHGS